jgi:Family of unknown function (DUF6263)
MKNLLLTFIAILFLVNPGFSQLFDLSFNLEKGKTYPMNSNADISILQEVNGQKINVSSVIGGDISIEILEVNTEGYRIAMRYQRFTMKIGVAGKLVEVDTDDESNTELMTNLLKGMIDVPIYSTMTRKGEMSNFENMDELFTSCLDRLGPDIDEAAKQKAMEQMKTTLNPKTLAASFTQITNIFPDSPVALGQLWKKKYTIEQGMALSSKAIYKLEKVTDEFLLISGTSELQNAKSAQMNVTSGGTMEMNMAGTSVTVMKLDRKTGWILEGEVRMNMSGENTYTESSTREVYKIPMVLNSTITY